MCRRQGKRRRTLPRRRRLRVDTRVRLIERVGTIYRHRQKGEAAVYASSFATPKVWGGS